MLIGLFIVLIVLAGLLFLYPARTNRKLSFCLLPCFLVLVGLGYFHWGGFSLWSTYLQKQERIRQAQQVLQSMQSPTEIIQRLQTQLQRRPDSAKGWYLLGRLYSQQKQWPEARAALARAYKLEPDHEQYSVQYAYSLWQAEADKGQAISILHKILQKNPQQADALALLAEQAFQHKQYQAAIGFWRRLLVQVPTDSPEAEALRKAIARAATLS